MLIVWNLVCGQCLGVLAFVRRLLGYLFSITKQEPYQLTSDQLGQQAEWLAARFFMRRGYSVLAHRERLQSAEIDLILIDHRVHPEQLLVVEVKASRWKTGLPHRRFTMSKKQRIELATREFVRRHHLNDVLIRLELVTVIWGKSGVFPALTRFCMGRVAM